MYGVFSSLVIRSTMWTIVLLAVDRILAVVVPFTYAARIQYRHGAIASVVVLTHSTIMVVVMTTTTTQVCIQSFKYAYESNHQHFFLMWRLIEFTTANLVVILLSVTTVTMLLYRKTQPRAVCRKFMRRVEYDLTRMIISLLIAFCICYIPFTIYICIIMRPEWAAKLDGEAERKYSQFVMTMLTINNFLNPLLYLIFSTSVQSIDLSSSYLVSVDYMPGPIIDLVP
eukprot:sb/3469570/